MPDDIKNGHNGPPQNDHDRLIKIMQQVSTLENEVTSLRDWRHNAAAPVMIEIQAQQRQNALSIGNLSAVVEKLVNGLQSLESLPGVVSEHMKEDRAAFNQVSEGIMAIHDKIDERATEIRAASADGQRSIILWVASMSGIGLCAVIAAMWGMLGGHLAWH